MQTPLDAFAGLLADLAADGVVPASRLSAKARERLAPLFSADVLVERRAGAGRRIEVRNADTLARFIERHYPAGLFSNAAAEEGLDRRTLALSRYRDTKALGGLDFEIVEYRLTGKVPLLIGGTAVGWSGVSGDLGAFVLYGARPVNREVRFSGVVATVENPTVLIRHDWANAGVDLAIATYGRMSRRLIDWLASESMRDARVVHYGDYDPVGLGEFCRLEAALGDRADLFIPAEIGRLFSQYSDRELLSRSAGLLPALQRSPHNRVQGLLRLMAEFGGALEHEALLIYRGEHDQGT
ncbi:MAG: hypothetical protein BGO63_03255 [Candidatus Accumulibacter sp. 66-26]|nr:hypothetical protein [Accumulibacter sp.]OJW48202.1 MAG: hypothetical protein BGO63_03255 [Candidatus Accumulibacter sp. 66-26]